MRDAIWLSVRAGLVATGIALVLGSAAAFAIARFRFFGREAVSFLLVLPIALPGIITGMALNAFFVFERIDLSTALVAGGLLAFALSFDEVIVTTFTAGAQNTLPLLIFGHIRLGQQLPVVNAIAFAMIVLTVIPVALAQRLMRDTGVLRRGAAAVTESVESSQIPAL